MKLIKEINETVNYLTEDSSGKKETAQETITSIRQPYVKKIGTIVQPEPESGCRIVTQSQINYLRNHYHISYSSLILVQ